MSVLIYRNILNNEIKSLAKIGKIIHEDLEPKGINISTIYDPRKKNCLDEMKNHDTIIFITHGSDDTMFHRYVHTKNSHKHHQSLINSSSINALEPDILDAIKGKKIVSISCRTARDLGPTACLKGGCKVYLGFYTNIRFDKLLTRKTGGVLSVEFNRFMLKCYKKAFSFVLEEAILNGWTFSKLEKVMSIELRRVVASSGDEIIISDRYYNKLISGQAILAITNVSENIRVFGDSSEIVG